MQFSETPYLISPTNSATFITVNRPRICRRSQDPHAYQFI